MVRSSASRTTRRRSARVHSPPGTGDAPATRRRPASRPARGRRTRARSPRRAATRGGARRRTRARRVPTGPRAHARDADAHAREVGLAGEQPGSGAGVERLDAVQGVEDVLEQGRRVVVVPGDRDPGRRAIVGVDPLGQQRGLAVARARGDEHHRAVGGRGAGRRAGGRGGRCRRGSRARPLGERPAARRPVGSRPRPLSAHGTVKPNRDGRAAGTGRGVNPTMRPPVYRDRP